MSGHSKWHSIKHKKAAADAKRGKLFSKLIKEIQVAARMGSGDVDANPRLRKAVTDAKGSGMAADTIKRAIARGTGELEGAVYEELTYEATGPAGTLFLVEVMTDNKNRTVAELRKIFEKNSGAIGATGSALWAFDRKGVTVVPKEAATEEQIMEIAVGAGAEDYSDEGDEWQVTSETSDMDAIVSALDQEGVKVSSSEQAFLPKNKKTLTGKEAERCLKLYDLLDDHDDCQNVYADFDIPDEELARIEGEG